MPPAASTTQRDNPIITGGRWLLVLPTAICAAVAAYYVLGSLTLFGFSGAGVDLQSFYGRLVSGVYINGIFGWAFIVGGSKMAPRGKIEAAQSLAIFGAMALGAAIIFHLSTGDYWAVYKCCWAAVGLFVGIALVTEELSHPT